MYKAAQAKGGINKTRAGSNVRRESHYVGYPVHSVGQAMIDTL